MDWSKEIKDLQAIIDFETPLLDGVIRQIEMLGTSLNDRQMRISNAKKKIDFLKNNSEEIGQIKN